MESVFREAPGAKASQGHSLGERRVRICLMESVFRKAPEKVTKACQATAWEEGVFGSASLEVCSARPRKGDQSMSQPERGRKACFGWGLMIWVFREAAER